MARRSGRNDPFFARIIIAGQPTIRLGPAFLFLGTFALIVLLLVRLGPDQTDHDTRPAEPRTIAATRILDTRPRRIEALERELRFLAHRHPELARLETIGQSVEGRDIRALRLGDPAAPRAFILGGIHGREWYTHVVAMELARDLILSVAGRKLLGQLGVDIVPLANPDGYEHSNRAPRPQGPGRQVLWRKNRRAPAMPVGTQLHDDDHAPAGVDLNRNFDSRWKHLGSPNPRSNNYRGAHAASEPEVAALQTFLTGDRHVFGLDIHSGGPYQIHAPARSDRSTPFPPTIRHLAKAMTSGFRSQSAPSRYGPRPERQRFLFEASAGGQGVNFLHAQRGMPAFTVEIGRFFDTIEVNDRQAVVTAWVHAIRTTLESVADGPGIRLQVRSCDGNPLPTARATMRRLDAESVEFAGRFRQEPLFVGDGFDAALVPGLYEIEISAKGFESRTVAVQLGVDDGWRCLEIPLERL